MHIAILDTNTDRSDFAARHPTDVDRFADMLRLVRPGWTFTAYAVKDGIFPEDHSDIDGFIVTGSPASVNDPDPWIGRLMSTIRRIADERIPLFGACFGHQAIARALGGEVGANPGGWRFGLVPDVPHERQPWMAGDGGAISLYAAHKEQVLRLPEGATVIGGTPDCPVGAFTAGPSVLATQYHPEMTPDFVAALADEMEGLLTGDEVRRARESLAAEAERERFAAWVARFFEAAHVAGRDAQDKAASRSIAVT
jgi:GMP synthase-like glutamine amidotransferase